MPKLSELLGPSLCSPVLSVLCVVSSLRRPKLLMGVVGRVSPCGVLKPAMRPP